MNNGLCEQGLLENGAPTCSFHGAAEGQCCMVNVVSFADLTEKILRQVGCPNNPQGDHAIFVRVKDEKLEVLFDGCGKVRQALDGLFHGNNKVQLIESPVLLSVRPNSPVFMWQFGDAVELSAETVMTILTGYGEFSTEIVFQQGVDLVNTD